MKRTSPALAILLAFAGVLVLIGCIPIPATRQFQPDGTRRPEAVVGTDAKKPVRLGQTRIDDAFIELSRRVRMTRQSGLMSSVTSRLVPAWSILKWQVDPQGRRYAIHYSVRTSTWVMPLCFSAEAQTAQRWLILDVDRNGIVTSATTTAQPPGWPTACSRWFGLFDEPTRQKLHAAGVFPSDEHLQVAAQAAEAAEVERRARRRAAPRPSFPTDSTPANNLPPPPPGPRYDTPPSP